MTQHQAQIFKIHGLVCQDCQDFFLPIFSQTQKVYSAKKFSEFSSVHVVVVVVPWLGILRGERIDFFCVTYYHRRQEKLSCSAWLLIDYYLYDNDHSISATAISHFMYLWL